VNGNILANYKAQLNRVEKLFSKTSQMLSNLDRAASQQKEKSALRKLESMFEAKSKEFENRKQEMDRLFRSRRLDRRIENIQINAVETSLSSSVHLDQRQTDLPIMLVYDQEKFVNERQDKIKQIKSDARDINSLAVQINQKVEEQDKVLDTLEKDLNKNKEVIQKANQELFIAAESG
jgi:hypothetical protein